ncbi:MAG: hypothetical protein EBQ80_00580, partial [Proteobacteria bacterium]|nr:hypothetical protein [Pseudomonadota bacterium]
MEHLRVMADKIGVGWLLGGLALLAVLVMVPGVLLLSATLPQADDYCVAAQVQRVGLWQFGHDVYFGWSGRVVSHVLIGLPVWLAAQWGGGWVVWLGILNGVVMGLCLLAMVALWRVLLGSWRWALLLAVVGTAWLWWHWLGVRDAVYWWAAVATYTTGLPLLCMIVVGMVGVVARQWWWRIAGFLLAAVGLALMSSLNEPLAVLGVALAVGFLGYLGMGKLGYQDMRVSGSQVVFGILLLVLAFGALVVLVAAPGNTVRVSVSTAPQGLVTALVAGIPMGIGFVLAQVNVALLVWLGWVAAVIRFLKLGRERGQLWQLVAILGGMMVAVVVLTPALGLYANGESLAPRTLNQMLYMLWLGLSLVVGWMVMEFKFKVRQEEVWLKVVSVALVIVLVSNVPLMRAVNDMRRVGDFTASFAERERLLA